MNTVVDIVRRTSTDAVYDTLHEEIVTLEILPGAKLSETEVARRFGVSRQPVRNAFTKLGNEGFLLIRPQKATIVRGFSMDRISHSRFIRRAIEFEIARCGIKIWNAESEKLLDGCIALQEQAIAAGNLPEFHALDYEFHRIIYEQSGHPLAFEVLKECKQKVDRLCVLSLTKDSEADSVLDDHKKIAAGMASGDLDTAISAIKKHLSRLDDTIDFVHEKHPEYFE